MTPERFDLIEEGATREETSRLLPDHELTDPRTDGQCHDYAVTADIFDDASGDVYRICFTDDRVSSARRLSSEER